MLVKAKTNVETREDLPRKNQSDVGVAKWAELWLGSVGGVQPV